jgi:transposase, IS30 family
MLVVANMVYKQFTYKERVQIETLLGEKSSIREISRKLGRSPSSISREIKNNKGGPKKCHYSADFAQQQSKFTRYITGRRNKKKSPEILGYVEKSLKKDWTPEQISNRIKIDHPDWSISIETIYQHVADQGLEDYLAMKRPIRRKRRIDRKRREMIPNRTGIEFRGPEADNRDEAGHKEIDAIVSKHNSVSLNVIVDRKLRMTQITKLANMKPKTTEEVVISRLREYPSSHCKTLTYDNGIENKNHEAINEALKVKSFFCNPYSSWEKGTVENTNGLIRRYFPKKTDFSKVTDDNIKFVEDRLNNRPRKCLAYLTPNEAYQKATLNSGCCSSN